MIRGRRAVLAAGVALGVLTPVVAVSFGSSGAQASPQWKASSIKHVWNIVLENEDYATTFGNPSADPYLARTLPAHGALLENYYGTGHESDDNYISLISGQPPNPDTQSDCQIYSGFVGGVDDNGIETGAGCVFPSSIPTIGNQLTAKGLNWKAYEQDMGNDASREAAACGHPALDTQDGTQTAEAGDGYATRHDPFVYFQSVTGDQTPATVGSATGGLTGVLPSGVASTAAGAVATTGSSTGSTAYCKKHVVAMGSTSGALPTSKVSGETGLATDLKSVKTTPSYSFITPNLCNDGHDYPCKNQASGASALADIDTFLQTWVPRITASAAYKQGGLIEITFDESDGPQSDSSACCNEKPGPASALPGITGPGGGKIGAVLLSPYIRGGTKVTTPLNHYSTLAGDEAIFGLSRLGDAASASLPITSCKSLFRAR